jgi:hypothetical protein
VTAAPANPTCAPRPPLRHSPPSVAPSLRRSVAPFPHSATSPLCHSATSPASPSALSTQHSALPHPLDALPESDQSQILSLYLRPDLSPADIASNFGLRVRDLIAWINRPDIDERLEALHQFTEKRTRRTAAIIQHKAVDVCRAAMDAYLTAEAHDLLGSDARSKSLRLRQSIIAIRAATTILRLSGALPTPRPRAAAPAGPTSGAQAHAVAAATLAVQTAPTTSPPPAPPPAPASTDTPRSTAEDRAAHTQAILNQATRAITQLTSTNTTGCHEQATRRLPAAERTETNTTPEQPVVPSGDASPPPDVLPHTPRIDLRPRLAPTQPRSSLAGPSP